MNLHMNSAQQTLYYIAENMKMQKKISDEGYRHFQLAIKAMSQYNEEKQEIDNNVVSPTAVPVTPEEAKKLLYKEWRTMSSFSEVNPRLLVAYQVAMKSLEQPSIPLDKIEQVKKEILDNVYTSYDDYDDPCTTSVVVGIEDITAAFDRLLENNIDQQKELDSDTEEEFER